MDAKLETKVLKTLGQEAKEALDAMGPDELRAHLVSLSEHERETQVWVEQSAEIRELKEQLSMLMGPTRETLRGIKLRRAYAVERLDEVGRVAVESEPQHATSSEG